MGLATGSPPVAGKGAKSTPLSGPLRPGSATHDPHTPRFRESGADRVLPSQWRAAHE
jgi:hypothetical protein